MKCTSITVAVAAGAASVLTIAACGASAQAKPAVLHSSSTPTLSVPHLSSGDQGVVCAGINALVVTGAAHPFATEAGATGYKFRVSTADAAPAVAAAIRARCPNYDRVIPAGK